MWVVSRESENKFVSFPTYRTIEQIACLLRTITVTDLLKCSDFLIIVKASAELSRSMANSKLIPINSLQLPPHRFLPQRFFI